MTTSFTKMRLASSPCTPARDALPTLKGAPSPRSQRMKDAVKSGRRMSLNMHLDAARAGLVPTLSAFEVAQFESRTASSSGLRLDLELRNEAESGVAREDKLEMAKARAAARAQKGKLAKEQRGSLAALAASQRLENSMDARLQRRGAAERAVARRAVLARRFLVLVLLGSRAQAAAVKITARHASLHNLAHSHAAKTVVRVMRNKLWRRRCARASDLLLQILRDRRQMLFATLAYKAWLSKITIVQRLWRRKGCTLQAQVLLLANAWATADKARIAQDLARLQKKDRAWVRAENEHVLHFNQHHTGRIAGAQSIERQPKAEELPPAKIAQQACYFSEQQARAALRRVLLRRELRFLRGMRLVSEALWPQFVQLVRDENISLGRGEVQRLCVVMRQRNQMIPFMLKHKAIMDAEVSGVSVPEPFKRVPAQSQLVDLQREEAQLLVPELGKRESALPSWYLDDLHGKQDSRPNSRQKKQRRYGSSSGSARRTSVISARRGSRSGSKGHSIVQSAMSAATSELSKVEEE